MTWTVDDRRRQRGRRYRRARPGTEAILRELPGTAFEVAAALEREKEPVRRTLRRAVGYGWVEIVRQEWDHTGSNRANVYDLTEAGIDLLD